MHMANAIRLSLFVCVLIAALGFSQGEIMDQKAIRPLLGKDGPIDSAGNITKEQGESHQAMGIAGGLSIHVMHDPSFTIFSRGLSGEDRYLGLRLSGEEWGALFLGVLECPDVSDVPQLPQEDKAEWQERYTLRFHEALPQYKMLSRIWDPFIYVMYGPAEIGPLRDECLRVESQSRTSNEKAHAALTKLHRACDEASRLGSGLLFAPD